MTKKKTTTPQEPEPEAQSQEAKNFEGALKAILRAPKEAVIKARARKRDIST